MEDVIDRVPDHMALKIKHYGAPRDGIVLDLKDTLLIGVGLPYEEAFWPALMPPGAPLRDLAGLVVQVLRQSEGPAELAQLPERILLTVDKEGQRSPGKSTDRVGDKLQDGQRLYMCYGLYREDGVLRWRKEVPHRPAKDDPCAQCRSLVGLATVHSGFRIFRLCQECLGKASTVPPAGGEQPEATKTYVCVECGATKAPLHYRKKKKSWKAQCLGPCSAQSTEHRCCQNCDLPLDQAHKCGRCREVRYCSSECQKADWPRHKLECMEK